MRSTHIKKNFCSFSLEFLLLANFFFTSERKQSFFWRSTSDNFFLCFVEECFCRTLSLLCMLPFGVFLVNIFFINFDNKLFFSAHIFNELSFSDFCADKLFFSILFLAPPPPIIKWCVPYIILSY